MTKASQIPASTIALRLTEANHRSKIAPRYPQQPKVAYPMPSKISLTEKFAQFSDEWTPKIVAEANGQLFKLAKISGDFVWHTHDDDDEVFFVCKGRMTIQFRDHNVELGPGEMCVVPKGIEHCPVADPGTEIMLIEPTSTQHTGTVASEKTVAVENQQWI